MKYLFLLIVIPTLALGQEQADIPDIPIPYSPKQHYDQINTTGIKTVTAISREKQNQFKDDTLFVRHYNRLGQYSMAVNYYRNQIMNTVWMKYDSNDKQIEWIHFTPTGWRTTSNSYFNPFLKPDSIILIMENEGKVMMVEKISFFYENEKLTRRQLMMNKKGQGTNFYNYKDSLLVHFTSIVNPMSSFVSEYFYDDSNLLIEKVTYHRFDTTVSLWNKKNFTYLNGKVVLEEELTYDDKRIITRYTYSVDGKVHKISSSFNENFREAEFVYDGLNVKFITVKTNAISAYLKPQCPYLTGLVVEPITYVQEFFYDERNNLIQHRHSIDSILHKDVVYIIEYFE